MDEADRNRRITQSHQHDWTWNGRALKSGDFAALLDGRVVAVESNADDAIARLRAIEPEPTRGMVVEACAQTIDFVRRRS